MSLLKPHRPQPFLSLRDTAFRLGDRLVFEHTSWVFRRPEHWAILGANGSGKSLLADALRGRLPLVHGELRYHFQPPPGLSPEEAISHVSFEDRKAEVHDTVVQSRWNSLEEEGASLVRDYLSYERVMDINPFEVTARHRQARPRFERRMRRAVALLQAAPFLDRTLLSLSNGERQRIQLARALAHPMRLLILDEPFTGLDAATRAHFHAVLERLMDTPLRVLFIVTRIEDLPRHITHLLCVAKCHVLAAGPRAEILALPQVKRLLSTPSTGIPLRPRALTLLDTATSPRPDLPLLLRRRGPGRGGRPAGKPLLSSSALAFVPLSPALSPRSAGGEREKHWAAVSRHFLRARKFQPAQDSRAVPPAPPSGGQECPRSPPEIVRLRHATVRYGKTVILGDINWTIRAGESWALLGPNGSGKTTLLSLILGDNPQVYTNDIVVFGRPRGTGESVWEIRKHIGWVSPELHLHFNATATCFEAVVSGFHDSVGLFEPATARQRTAARKCLARFQLLAFAGRPLFSLSAGLQRMVLLARALVKRPRLLILDEPCQGLDAAHRDSLVRAVDALIRAGAVTVIYVTHRPDEIPPSITRVLRLPAPG